MASSSSKKLLKDLPSQEKMDEIMSDLKAFGPQATAILGAAYLEHATELLLRATFRPFDNSDDDGRMFRSAGILGSFSAKIRIAYAMGLFHKKVYEALLIINDIRTAFAHSLHVVDFDTKEISNDCAKLAKLSPKIAFSAGLLFGPNEEIDVYAKIVSLLYRSIRQKVEDINDGSAVRSP